MVKITVIIEFLKQYLELVNQKLKTINLIVILLYLRVIYNYMKHLLSNLKIDINDKIYLKDPESSDLGLSLIHI